jgi:hypothetical protein
MSSFHRAIFCIVKRCFIPIPKQARGAKIIALGKLQQTPSHGRMKESSGDITVSHCSLDNLVTGRQYDRLCQMVD